MIKKIVSYFLLAIITMPLIGLGQLDERTERIKYDLNNLNFIFLSEARLAINKNRSDDILHQIDNSNSKFIDPVNQHASAYKTIQTIYNQKGIYYPKNLSEVQALINFAKINHFQIRTMGASHSPQPAIYDADSRNQIKIILSGDLRKIESIKPDPAKEFAIIRTGAGCYLGVNPADHNSTLENSFNYQVDQAGYAIPTLGGISHQTIAGFLQTSSSGGTAKHTIADVIEEIEWVDGNGQIRSAKRGEDEFNAVAVSMGLFGIVTHITFKLPRRYFVEGKEVNKELGDSLLTKDEAGHYTKLHRALFTDNEYIRINWLPQAYVNRTMEWTGKSVSNSIPQQPYMHPLASQTMMDLANMGFKIGNYIDEYGNNNDALLKIKAEILKLFSDPKDSQEFHDVWYKALPIDDQTDVDGKIKTLFSELWFPEDKIDMVMQRLELLFKNNPKAAGNFIIELYCAKQSPFWLSPAYGHNAFRIDLYWWDHNIGDPNKYFGVFWKALLDIPGARLHWGKYVPIPGIKYGDISFGAELYQKNYPKMAEWLKLREKNDPQQLFVTNYWRQIFNIPKL